MASGKRKRLDELGINVVLSSGKAVDIELCGIYDFPELQKRVAKRCGAQPRHVELITADGHNLRDTTAWANLVQGATVTAAVRCPLSVEGPIQMRSELQRGQGHKLEHTPNIAKFAEVVIAEELVWGHREYEMVVKAVPRVADGKPVMNEDGAYGFDGAWDHGFITFSELTWCNGDKTRIDIINAKTINMFFDGQTFTAVLQDNGELHWSDGDVWTRNLRDDNQIAQDLQPHLDSPILGKSPFDILSENMNVFVHDLKYLEDCVEHNASEENCENIALLSNVVETYGTLFEAFLGPETYAPSVEVYNYIECDGNVFTAHFATRGYEFFFDYLH